MGKDVDPKKMGSDMREYMRKNDVFAKEGYQIPKWIRDTAVNADPRLTEETVPPEMTAYLFDYNSNLLGRWKYVKATALKDSGVKIMTENGDVISVFGGIFICINPKE